MLSFLNKRLVPAMRKLGYNIPENAKITVEKTINPKEQITIDSQLMSNGYILKQQYVEETYGVEIESLPNNNNTNQSSAKKP